MVLKLFTLACFIAWWNWFLVNSWRYSRLTHFETKYVYSFQYLSITHLEYQHDESLLLNYKFLASNLTSIPIIQNFKIPIEPFKRFFRKTIRIYHPITKSDLISSSFSLLKNNPFFVHKNLYGNTKHKIRAIFFIVSHRLSYL